LAIFFRPPPLSHLHSSRGRSRSPRKKNPRQLENVSKSSSTWFAKFSVEWLTVTIERSSSCISHKIWKALAATCCAHGTVIFDIYTYTYIHTCIYVHIYTYICNCIYIHKYIHIYLCMCIYIFTYPYVHIFIYIWVHEDLKGSPFCQPTFVLRSYYMYVCICGTLGGDPRGRRAPMRGGGIFKPAGLGVFLVQSVRFLVL